MASTIVTKNSSTASAVPLTGDLTQGELAVNVTDKRLFTKNSGGTVVELGTNPASLALPNGTANGVTYLNGSKVLTSGSALTYNGSTFKVAGTDAAIIAGFGGTTKGVRIETTATGTSIGGVDSAFVNSFEPLDINGSYTTYSTSGTERMRLTSTGLGIGTSSPSYKLDVVGGINASSNITSGGVLQALTTVQSSSGADLSLNANGLNRDIIYKVNATELMRLVGSTGNLGIGTSSPVGRLSAIGSDNATQAVFSGSIGGTGRGLRIATSLISSNNEGAILDAQATTGSATLIFQTASTERARIDSSGNLLVGTTSAGDSKVVFSFPGTVVGLTLQDSVDNSNAYFQAFRNSGGTIIGSVTRVGTTSAVIYNTTSDYRLKNVIGEITGSGARIDALEPVEYEWKENGKRTRGFLAHKFQEVYPQSVSGEKDAVDADGKPVYQAMQASTSEVIADLVAEIKSLRARVAQLESN